MSNFNVEVRNLSYVLRGRAILTDVSLTAAAGEFVGIIGPNGAGKSTLLRLIDRFLTPTAGQVLVENRPVRDYPMRELARKMAFMSQDMTPAFTTRVFDVVLMGRYAHERGLVGTTARDREVSQSALERVGLAGFEDRLFHELSTGERQLALIARLLAQEARILLLDEPTANLDISHRSQVFAVARDLTAKGHTVLAAIHDLNEASLHCSRLILLSGGRIAARGTPEEVLQPQILHPVYRVPTVVSRSPATGALLVEIAP